MFKSYSTSSPSLLLSQGSLKAILHSLTHGPCWLPNTHQGLLWWLQMKDDITRVHCHLELSFLLIWWQIRPGGACFVCLLSWHVAIDGAGIDLAITATHETAQVRGVGVANTCACEVVATWKWFCVDGELFQLLPGSFVKQGTSIHPLWERHNTPEFAGNVMKLIPLPLHRNYLFISVSRSIGLSLTGAEPSQKQRVLTNKEEYKRWLYSQALIGWCCSPGDSSAPTNRLSRRCKL